MGLTVSLLKNDAKCNAEKRHLALKQTGKILKTGIAATALAAPIMLEVDDDFCPHETKFGKKTQNVLKKSCENMYVISKKTVKFLSKQAESLKKLVINKLGELKASNFIKQYDFKRLTKSVSEAQKGGLILTGLAVAGFGISAIKTIIDTKHKSAEIDKKYEQKAQELTN